MVVAVASKCKCGLIIMAKVKKKPLQINIEGAHLMSNDRRRSLRHYNYCITEFAQLYRDVKKGW